MEPENQNPFRRYPMFDHLEIMAKSQAPGFFFSQPLQGDPEFFKYKWWIFHRGSSAEGAAFMTQEHQLSTAAAMQLIERLREQGEPFLVYNEVLPRLPVDGSPPWDMNAKRWKNARWAPNWHDDVDPEWRDGYK